jgi:hypothetical protein
MATVYVLQSKRTKNFILALQQECRFGYRSTSRGRRFRLVAGDHGFWLIRSSSTPWQKHNDGSGN